MRFNFKAIGITALLFGAPVLAAPAPSPEPEAVEPRGNVGSTVIGSVGLACAVWRLQYDYRNNINKDAAADINKAFSLEASRLKEVTKKYKEAAKTNAPKIVTTMEGFETQISGCERDYAKAMVKAAGDNKKQKATALEYFGRIEKIGKDVEKGCHQITASTPAPPPPSKKRPGKRSLQRRRVARALKFAA
ncbi:hypothetical protein RB595_008934 [Gaeumannomyces hyphopodioides]